MKLLGISGSLRRDSYNSALLRTAAGLMPDGATLEIASIAGIPLYDGDVEAKGVPGAVSVFKEAIAGSDGLLLATPEYNNSIPGPFKNAIDWASRPAADIPRVFGARPVALVGASPGAFGTILAQNAWLPVFRTLGMEFWSGGRLLVPRAGSAFEQGGLVDPALRERLAAFLSGFVAFVRKQSGISSAGDRKTVG